MKTDVRTGRTDHRIGEGEMSNARRVMLAIVGAAWMASTVQACSGSPTDPSTAEITPDVPRDTSEHIPADPPEMEP